MITKITRGVGLAVKSRILMQLSGPRFWMLVGLFVIALALLVNWQWLAAIGLAPVLLSLLPCLLMCGLGLCLHRLTGKSCQAEPSDSGRLRDSVETPAELMPIFEEPTPAVGRLAVPSAEDVDSDDEGPVKRFVPTIRSTE